jgi:hypothetical protein
VDLLVKGQVINVKAEMIVYNAEYLRWDILDRVGTFLYAAADEAYTLVKNVTLPEDYEDGKYFYVNGRFVLNENWKPYVSTEERMAQLEAQNEMLLNCVLEMSEIIYA